MTAVHAPTTLTVSEVFGPTLQGEGVSTGRRAGFLRLGRCNLTCTWCDTPYTWNWRDFDPDAELHEVDVAAAADRIRALDVPLLVVTGGEPLMQQPALGALFRLLPPELEIEVETNGTIPPAPAVAARVARFNVSPKLANSAVRAGKRTKAPALRALAGSGKAVFKFVVDAPDDLAEIEELVRRYELRPVYVMPQGTTAQEVLAGMRWLSDAALARGWNLSTRLHVLLWGDRRGV